MLSEKQASLSSKFLTRKRRNKTMDFFTALKKVAEGKAITRTDWNDPSVHVRLTHTSHPLPVLAIFNGVKGGNRYHDWLVSQEDLEMEWEVTVVMPESIPLIQTPKVVQGGLIKPNPGILLARPNSSPVPKKN